MDTLSQLSRLESVIASGLETFLDVGNALRKIRDERLYRDGYQSFEAYAKERWGWGKAYAYRMIQAAQVDENLSPIGDSRSKPKNESQYREVGKAPAELQAAVVEAAAAKAAEENREPTAKDFKQAVADVVYEDVEPDDELPDDDPPEKTKPVKDFDAAVVSAFERSQLRLGTLKRIVNVLLPVEVELLREWLRELKTEGA
jgi:hypothetical protein